MDTQKLLNVPLQDEGGVLNYLGGSKSEKKYMSEEKRAKVAGFQKAKNR